MDLGATFAVAADAGICVVFGIASGAASRVAVGATVSATAGSVDTPDTLIDTIRWGAPLGFALAAENNVVEENIWPFALDATQRAAHVAGMRAKWSGLLPG